MRQAAFWAFAVLVYVIVAVSISLSLSKRTVGMRAFSLFFDAILCAGYWWIFSLAWRSL